MVRLKPFEAQVLSQNFSTQLHLKSMTDAVLFVLQGVGRAPCCAGKWFAFKAVPGVGCSTPQQTCQSIKAK